MSNSERGKADSGQRILPFSVTSQLGSAQDSCETSEVCRQWDLRFAEALGSPDGSPRPGAVTSAQVFVRKRFGLIYIFRKPK